MRSLPLNTVCSHSFTCRGLELRRTASWGSRDAFTDGHLSHHADSLASKSGGKRAITARAHAFRKFHPAYKPQAILALGSSSQLQLVCCMNASDFAYLSCYRVSAPMSLYIHPAFLHHCFETFKMPHSQWAACIVCLLSHLICLSCFATAAIFFRIAQLCFSMPEEDFQVEGRLRSVSCGPCRPEQGALTRTAAASTWRWPSSGGTARLSWRSNGSGRSKASCLFLCPSRCRG